MLDRFTGMRVFVEAATRGSLSAAARGLAMSPAMATKHMDAMEARLGIKLLHRTTRRLSLTDAGSEHLEACRRLLQELEEAETNVRAQGLEAAKPFIALLCKAQNGLAEQAAKERQEFPVFPPYTDEVFAAVEKKAGKKLGEIMTIAGKHEREDAANDYMVEIEEQLVGSFAENPDAAKEVRAAYNALMKKIVRQKILTEGFRIDGRGVADLRDLGVEVDLIPRAHGSALFERGETQILGVTTLDMLKMEQQIDSLSPETSKRYIHHYNFPPYSTGETGRVGSPKRREIGHGALAERALEPVIPSREEFPYTIRQVSEALSSNGSTSMGSVCASTLSLYNAGVPLKAPVAGIAMGLVSDEVDGETRYVALTDILGAEDAFGDMDFKVAGTPEFITALQLDTKLDGIPSKVLADALEQARDARLTILEVMAEAIDEPDEMSPYAPKITTEDARIDWSQPDFAVDRHIRAHTPGPGAWTMLLDDRVKIGPVTLGADVEGLAPGEVHVDKNTVSVGTGTGAVTLGTAQPPGKKMMNAADWARGNAALQSGEKVSFQ